VPCSLWSFSQILHLPGTNKLLSQVFVPVCGKRSSLFSSGVSNEITGFKIVGPVVDVVDDDVGYRRRRVRRQSERRCRRRQIERRCRRRQVRRPLLRKEERLRRQLGLLHRRLIIRTVLAEEEGLVIRIGYYRIFRV